KPEGRGRLRAKQIFFSRCIGFSSSHSACIGEGGTMIQIANVNSATHTLGKFLMPICLAFLCMTVFSTGSWADDDDDDDGGGPTLVVGKPGTPCPHAKYSTITDAIKAAPPGAKIKICPALYPERLTIEKPLTLRGVSVNGVNRILLQPVASFDAVI